MKQLTINTVVYTQLALLLLISVKSFSQSDSTALAVADTTGFTINRAQHWQLFNSYVSEYQTDSVQLELIVQQKHAIDWYSEHYIGSIKDAALHPPKSQTIRVNLIKSQYELRIDMEGRCFIQYKEGEIQSDGKVVIPLLVRYKKQL